MQIPIISGIYTDNSPDFRTSYPKNLVPVPQSQGISQGYLKTAEGIVKFGDASGVDRGGINWNGRYYRVMDSKLVLINSIGSVTILGDVGDNGKPVTLTYSFDYLAIASNENLFYYDEKDGLQQVTDADLGTVLDVVWVDGYFMTTDGEYLVVTDIDDPFSVNPLKYGSSEAAPDPIVALEKLRNEVYALNRYTIEVFDNVGGTQFPFQRIESAQIERGVIGTHACTVFLETVAFVGSGEKEAPAVWLGNNSSSVKISTREIDQILSRCTEEELSKIIVESRVDEGHEFLYIHLKDRTLVYDGRGSQALRQPIWFTLSSSIDGNEIYQARNFVWCYNKWLCGNPVGKVHGYLTNETAHHYDKIIEWEFGTSIIYNGSNGAIFHELELVALTGRVDAGTIPSIWTSYSKDGMTWSQEKSIRAGTTGNRLKRLVWLQQGNMQNFRIQKFRGTSEGRFSFARLEARMEPLYE